MSSVWYVALDDERVIRSADWDDAGTSDGGDFAWNRANGYSVAESAFTADQLAYLDSLDTEFWVGAPDGPRQVVVADPAGYVTEARVRELIAQTPVMGLTAAWVGLGHVDDVPDAAKPVSGPQAAALAGKADYPAGGGDGQVLVKAGTSTAWAVPSSTGGNPGSTAVVGQADPDWDSGTVYAITGSGVAPVADADWQSGTTYTVS